MFGDKLEQDGQNNVLAGRDATVITNVFDHKSLRQQFSEKLQAIDARINALLPRRLLSPTANNTYEPFDTGKLLASLAKTGIPVDVGIEIVESLEEHLKPILEGQKVVSTTHIRRAVLAAIYDLRKGSYSETLVAEWAAIYARRFGNPDEPLRVLHRDGLEEALDFSFLQKTLIPHLVESVIRANYEDLLGEDEVLSGMEVRRMARDIIEHVKGLNLYSIRYKTLYNLAYDLAVQPPHPWFVDKTTRKRTVTYNLERAGLHVDRLEALVKQEDKTPWRHAIREIIHHSCAAILAHYHAFLGASQLGSLNQLIHALSISKDENNPILWSFSELRKIEGDLAAIGSSKEGLFRTLDRLKRNIDASDENLGKTALKASELASVAERLIKADTRIRLLTGKESPLNADELFELVSSVLAGVPGMNLTATAAPNHTWITHRAESGSLRWVQPRIFVKVVPAVGCPHTWNHLCSNASHLKEVVAGDSHSNTAILAGMAFDSSCYSGAKDVSTKEFYLYLLTSNDLVRVFTSKNRLQELSNVFDEQLT